jgi:predicted DNA-binding protein (MmcQ/YjbR family)
MLNLLPEDEILEYLDRLPDVNKTNPFESGVDVYSVGEKMFALINNKHPIIISLRCDKILSKVLQDKYESVMPGQKLDQQKWISVINSGQVPITEIKDLILLSYNLVSSD